MYYFIKRKYAYNFLSNGVTGWRPICQQAYYHAKCCTTMARHGAVCFWSDHQRWWGQLKVPMDIWRSTSQSRVCIFLFSVVSSPVRTEKFGLVTFFYEEAFKSNFDGPTQTDDVFIRFLSAWIGNTNVRRCVWVGVSAQRWPDPFRRRAKKNIASSLKINICI